jgi:hypothetical protein
LNQVPSKYRPYFSGVLSLFKKTPQHGIAIAKGTIVRWHFLFAQARHEYSNERQNHIIQSGAGAAARAAMVAGGIG